MWKFVSSWYVFMKVWWAEKSSFNSKPTPQQKKKKVEKFVLFSLSFSLVSPNDMFHDVRHDFNNLLYGS